MTPDPEKKPGRTNNRKMVFDGVCRVILFDGIAPLRGQTPILVIGDDLFVLQLRLGADGIGYKLHGLVVSDFRNLVNQGLGILQPERHGFQTFSTM